MSGDVKQVVDLALEAGRILLKNGGEIFRVDETIKIICKSYQVNNVDTFILSHGIFISAEDEEGKVYTRVKHIPLSGTHLGIVAEVNSLSREIAAGKIEPEKALLRLSEIDRILPKPFHYLMIAAGVGSGVFTVLLGFSAAEGFAAFCIGFLLYIWVLIAGKFHLSKIILNIVGGIMITALAIGFIHIPGFPVDQMEGMITGAIMPLIPGVAFVNSIRDIADGDFLSGTVRMIDALLVFVYIAIGVGVSLSFYNKLIGGLPI